MIINTINETANHLYLRDSYGPYPLLQHIKLFKFPEPHIAPHGKWSKQTYLHLRVVAVRTSNDDDIHKTLSKAGIYYLWNKQQLFPRLLGNINAIRLRVQNECIHSMEYTL